ncbi:MAG: hypothetical protein J6N51_13500 [Selenomonas sp.]|nr:hypothetical protein [Selenomonas sp.]
MNNVDKCVFGMACLFPLILFYVYGLALAELKNVFMGMFMFSAFMSAWPHDIRRAYPWMFLCAVTLVLGIFLPEE